MRNQLWAVLGLAAAVTFQASQARAISNCSARVDRTTGIIEVSGSKLVGTPKWGFALTNIASDFADPTCINGTRLRKCQLSADDSLARRVPASCKIYVADGLTHCQAPIADCARQPADRSEDGVRHINAELAALGGISSSDIAGLPITLSEPGVYRLMGAIQQSNPDEVLIEVAADDVTIDLNGFTLSGASVCNSLGCSPTGSGRAITRIGGAATRMGRPNRAMQQMQRAYENPADGCSCAGLSRRE